MSKLLGEGLAEFETPETHGFIAHGDIALSQQFLDLMKAEAEAMIQPDGVGNNLRRETVIPIDTCVTRENASVTAYETDGWQVLQ